MQIAPVSFGKVIAVAGKRKKISGLERKLSEKGGGRLFSRDITYLYKNSANDGELARAANRGKSVNLYVTGDDVQKVGSKNSGWTSIDFVLSDLSEYYSADDMSINYIAKKILE